MRTSALMPANIGQPIRGSRWNDVQYVLLGRATRTIPPCPRVKQTETMSSRNKMDLPIRRGTGVTFQTVGSEDESPVPLTIGRSTMHAWLLDLYEHETDGLVVWVILEDGQRLRLRYHFPVTFYAAGPASRLHELAVWLRAQEPALKTLPS